MQRPAAQTPVTRTLQPQRSRRPGRLRGGRLPDEDEEDGDDEYEYGAHKPLGHAQDHLQGAWLRDL